MDDRRYADPAFVCASARDSRQFAAAAARKLVQLTGGDLILHDVDWDSIVSLPFWCFLDVERIRELQMVCGSVVMLDVIQMTVDGAYLKKVRDCLGRDVFNHLFHLEVPSLRVVRVDQKADVEDAFLCAGASVLLGTLRSLEVRDGLKSMFQGRTVCEIDRIAALGICRLASDILVYRCSQTSCESNEFSSPEVRQAYDPLITAA